LQCGWQVQSSHGVDALASKELYFGRIYQTERLTSSRYLCCRASASRPTQ
jgi:hypothetical protein